MALLLAGLALALVVPAPDCSAASSLPVCEKAAYEARTIYVLLLWVCGLLCIMAAITVYVMHVSQERSSRKRARDQQRAQAAATARDARGKVAVRDTLARR